MSEYPGRLVVDPPAALVLVDVTCTVVVWWDEVGAGGRVTGATGAGAGAGAGAGVGGATLGTGVELDVVVSWVLLPLGAAGWMTVRWWAALRLFRLAFGACFVVVVVDDVDATVFVELLCEDPPQPATTRAAATASSVLFIRPIPLLRFRGYSVEGAGPQNAAEVRHR